LPPYDGLADSLVGAQMIQHIVLRDIGSLLIVLGLTGPVLAPSLRTRPSQAMRRLSHPLMAVALWALGLYAWHLPISYQLAIEHDLVHALAHATLLWLGDPPVAGADRAAAQAALVRRVGARPRDARAVPRLSSGPTALSWGQTAFYPIYRAPDVTRALSPLFDQSLAGGMMMVEQVVLTRILLGWLFQRWARRAEDAQSLLDLAAARGRPLADERAARAAQSGHSARLRERLADRPPPADRAGSPGLSQSQHSL
jgi:cytochrome c oxidase assembly factor CtaG